MQANEKPPVFTCVNELLAWTLDRTASFPKSHRFTIGQRIDNFTLDCLDRVIEAIYSAPSRKAGPLTALNLLLEKLRALWRIARARSWISERQLFFVTGRIDEIGRMTGGWLNSLAAPRK